MWHIFRSFGFSFFSLLFFLFAYILVSDFICCCVCVCVWWFRSTLCVCQTEHGNIQPHKREREKNNDKWRRYIIIFWLYAQFFLALCSPAVRYVRWRCSQFLTQLPLSDLTPFFILTNFRKVTKHKASVATSIAGSINYNNNQNRSFAKKTKKIIKSRCSFFDRLWPSCNLKDEWEKR